MRLLAGSEPAAQRGRGGDAAHHVGREAAAADERFSPAPPAGTVPGDLFVAGLAGRLPGDVTPRPPVPPPSTLVPRDAGHAWAS